MRTKCSALNVDFNSISYHLRSKRPPYERIKFGCPLENVRLLLLSTNLAREWLQRDTDLLRIITSTAVDVLSRELAIPAVTVQYPAMYLLGMTDGHCSLSLLGSTDCPPQLERGTLRRKGCIIREAENKAPRTSNSMRMEIK